MKRKRAYSPAEILRMNIPKLEFDGAWAASMGKPAKSGVWLIWGNPGNGKTSFVMQLAKYLCQFDKVVYDSLEESTSLSVQMSMRRHKMEEVNRRFQILDREGMDQLVARLQRRKSAGIAIIDSFQYSGLTYKGYQAMKEALPGKLLIFISHAEGMRPAGRAAKKVEYDADIKILVDGFRASCKSRYMDTPGVPFTVWAEGAAKYWLGRETEQSNINEQKTNEDE